MDDKSGAYQLISNLLHKRDRPIKLSDTAIVMSESEINDASKQIKERISSFDYVGLLKKIQDDAFLKKLYIESACNYEKLHIYRVLFDDKPDKINSNVISKFINQAFHLENDYIYQLNPCEYQLVPQYVIDECDKHIAEL